jgi:hypothetical protein
MLMALAFKERDVDAFLGPQGWRATNMAATRIAWMVGMQGRGKRDAIDEADLLIRVPIPASDTPNTTAAIAEARAIRGEILNGIPNG